MRKVARLLVLLASACGSHSPRSSAPPSAAPAPAPRAAAADAAAASAAAASVTETAGAPAAPVDPALALASVGLHPDWMETAADPCQDFYRFACGRYVAESEIPPDQASNGFGPTMTRANQELLRSLLERSGDDPADQIGGYYRACMDETRIEKAGVRPARLLLDGIARAADRAAIRAQIGHLHAQGIRAFFDLIAVPDAKDATQQIASLTEGGLGLPDRDYYSGDEGPKKAVREFYHGHVERMLGLAGLSAAEAAAGADDVLRIETALAAVTMTRAERADPHKIYHRLDRAALVAAAPRFPWDGYWKAVGLGAHGFPPLNVTSPPYLTAVDALLGSESPRALRHYLAWHLLREVAPTLSRPFVDEAFAMQQKLEGVKEPPPRWKRCVASTAAALRERLGQRYLEARFDDDNRRDAEAMADGIRAAMREELAGLAWMDEPTRAAAEDKLRLMTSLVGGPARPRRYDFAVGPDHATNFLAAARADVAWQLNKVGTPTDPGEWQLGAATVNANYNPARNRTAFPAAILQPPVFSKGFPAAVNFGGMGAVFGHELTHGFDPTGSQFDGHGSLVDWWSPATAKRFKEQSQCVVDLYRGFEAAPGLHLDGQRTVMENVADIGGLKLAWRGYRAARVRAGARPEIRAGAFGEDQMFFLAFGQLWCERRRPEAVDQQVRTDYHSPARFRVNGAASQLAEFGKTFSCPAGAPMRPATTCSVW
jgi:putative endopeptidase